MNELVKQGLVHLDTQQKTHFIKNLKKICRDFGVSYEETVIVGDNVAIDLMPAKLLKIKTILYTELVDYFAGGGTELEEIFVNQ